MSKPANKEQLLKQIKASVNILDVVGEHVVLRKAGSNHSGLCPFHSERSPSFSVSEPKQLYHCYGCKEGGDLISFMMKLHNLSFPEALEELAARGGITLPSDFKGGKGAGNPENQKKYQTAYRLNRFTAMFFRTELGKKNEEAKKAKEYLRDRGITANQEKEFYMGYAPSAWESLSEQLVKSKAPMEIALKLGTIRPTQKKNAGSTPYFDLFRNRVIFPILDGRGRVTGFGGRLIPGSAGEADKTSPKYLNSPDSPIFKKSKLLFGLFQAAKHIREKNEVILVEGFFDVMAMHAAGFQNTVATCGTALTAEHLVQLKRLASKVTILFDGDSAGQEATERAMEVGLSKGLVVYGVSLPNKTDPDEFLKIDGPTKMARALAEAKPLLDVRLAELTLEAATSMEAKSAALKKAARWLSLYSDPVGKELRVEELQKKWRVSKNLILTAHREGAKGESKRLSIPQGRFPAQRVAARPNVKNVNLSPSEKVIWTALAHSERYRAEFEAARCNLPPDMTLSDLFEHPVARSLTAELWGAEGELPNLEALQNLISSHGSEDSDRAPLNPAMRSALTEALMAGGTVYAEKEVKAAIQRGLQQSWARFSQTIRKAWVDAEASNDSQLQSRLMKDYLDVQRKMKEFQELYETIK